MVETVVGAVIETSAGTVETVVEAVILRRSRL